MTFVTLYVMTSLHGVVMKSFRAIHALEEADAFLTKTPPPGAVAAYAYDSQKQLLRQWDLTKK